MLVRIAKRIWNAFKAFCKFVFYTICFIVGAWYMFHKTDEVKDSTYYEAKTSKQWDAVYYPDRTDIDENTAVKIRNVGSLQACQDVVHQIARRYNDARIIDGDYMCYYNPKPDPYFGVVYEYKMR